MYLENIFRDECDNGRNSNTKEVISLTQDYLLYNIVWLGHLNIFFTTIKL